MSFDLFLHASEDQTRKIPKAEVDAAMTTLPGVSVVGKREYAFQGDGFRIELEVETETAAGGDVKGVYVHVAAGSPKAAYEKAKELSLRLVDALTLVIYDHQLGSYVDRPTFEAAPVPEDGVMFRVATGKPEVPKAAEPAPSAPRPSVPPAPAGGGGGCMGLVLAGGVALAALLRAFA